MFLKRFNRKLLSFSQKFAFCQIHYLVKQTVQLNELMHHFTANVCDAKPFYCDHVPHPHRKCITLTDWQVMPSKPMLSLRDGGHHMIIRMKRNPIKMNPNLQTFMRYDFFPSHHFHVSGPLELNIYFS